ncbi:MAG: insulinase family protein [Gammaproteobacteria bacterium]|nr:insulinase family protein [Gammaproteobacteria bacterium]
MNAAAAHPAFESIRQHTIETLDVKVHEYRHKVTGAPHFHFAADNPENVFLVGLRTVPEDSTGVAHILEHTVLCGSEKYPVRDPFFMMIRRSLNTFMNAFTSTDWTAYPFASQNRKDYFNLLDVYLDAVFFSRLHELDFAQEGHRLEFDKADDPDSDLTFKGVVFNEMKGAMSSPASILWQSLSSYLFPNNTYHYNSGGDPEAIPDLTYPQLKNFYDTHYHPSNAVFMTFGDIPANELQKRFQDQVLQRFEPLDRVIKVAETRRLHAPLAVEEAYPASSDDGDDKAHVVCGWLLGESVDLDQRLRAHLVSNVLLDNSASPLQKALETSELGAAPSPLCGLEDSNRNMVFVCGLEGTTPEQAGAIEQMILDVLQEIAEHGVPQAQIEAVMHQLELSQREIRGDGMPFGLQMVLSGLSTAMQRGDTIAAVDLDAALKRLAADVKTPGFLQNLVKSLLLDNLHRVRLTLRPDGDMSDRRNQAELDRLARIKNSLSPEETESIVRQAAALAARQAQQDDPEVLPRVTLADVPDDLPIAEGDEVKAGQHPAMFYPQGTNGLVYQDLILPLPKLPDELLPLLPYYTNYLTDVGCGGRDYLATQTLQSEVTGSLNAYSIQRSSTEDAQSVTGYLFLSGKALVRNQEALSNLMEETLTSARFDETTRLRELFAQSRAAREQSITGSGHALAMTAAASGMSPVTALSHRLTGLAGIQALKQLDDEIDDEAALKTVIEKLIAIHEIVATAPRQFMFVAEEENRTSILDGAGRSFSAATPASSFEHHSLAPVRERVNQLWTTSTEVNFVAKAFPTVSAAHDDAPALAVLGPYLRNGFLHRAIRETGGAYGGGATQDADSASFRFFSYRDPRLVETMDDFDASLEWLQQKDHDPRAVEEAILNVISSIDKPGSPAGRARSAFNSELFGRSREFQRERRRKILEVTLDDLQRVGKTYLDPETASVAAITSPARATEAASLQMEVKSV